MLFACGDESKPVTQNKTIDSAIPTDTVSSNAKPVFGYRFQITGDFDGDGKKEKLTEVYYSKTEKKETNKFYDGLDDVEQLIKLNQKKEIVSFLLCDNSGIDTVIAGAGEQHSGLAFLKNEGDLNGDKTDEISYVNSFADWSNINTCYVMTYKNGSWTKLYSFQIAEWQIPVLPQASTATTDTTDIRKHQELAAFKGLINKKGANKFLGSSYDEASGDIIDVDLK